MQGVQQPASTANAIKLTRNLMYFLSAFCHARMQLDPHALLALNRPLLEGFERDFTPRLWHGLASVGDQWFDGAFAEH